MRINDALYTEGWPGIGLQGEQNDQKDEKQGMKCKVDGDNLFLLNIRKFLHLSTLIKPIIQPK
jgi:hypothetical protein